MPAPQGALEYRLSLPPSPYQDRTGAVWLDHDPRDYPVAHDPTIAPILEAGAPLSADNSASVRGIYDQGNEGSCVSFSDCSAVGTEGVIAGQAWQLFDGHLFYRELGGTGQNGVDTRASLQRAVDVGIPIANTSARQRIGSYFFPDRTNGQAFLQECEAAVAANKCVVVALLLPAPFSWESGDAPTSAYHQMNLVGYDEVWWIFANSWGPSFGRNGFCRVHKSFIVANNNQNGYAYAATVNSLFVPGPDPQPQPVNVRQINGTAQGKAQGEGTSLLAVGQVLPFTSGPVTGTVTITQITDNVDPGPGPDPHPPGDVKVNVVPGRGYLAATVQDAGGSYLGATCSLTLGGVDKGTRQTRVQGAQTWAAVWAAANIPPGTRAVVTAVTEDGRQGAGIYTY